MIFHASKRGAGPGVCAEEAIASNMEAAGKKKYHFICSLTYLT
jgi:hypothetical protein